MMRVLLCLSLAALLIAPTDAADDNTAEDSPDKKYTLRYKFQPGETIRWKVVHRSRVRTTVSDTTQTAETVSRSVKLWRVTERNADGTVTFEHLVESVDMRQKLTGRDEVRYNSRTDKKPPVGFETMAKSIGRPLTIVTMDAHGKVLHRLRTPANLGQETKGMMTIPLPDEPVPVGHTWTEQHDVHVPLEMGGVKKVVVRQTFTLRNVKTGVATIAVANQILTPIHNPAIEAKLIERQSSGTVRLDIDAGRILGQQIDLDRLVVGFRGPASSLHYLTRFTEELLPGEAKIARREQGGWG